MPDNTFIIVDSAQIEARILAWLAGQENLLDGFRNGEDIYSVFATRLFGCEVRKPKETDSDSDKRILKIRRGFGKDAILGCGYGMGAKTFFERCRQNPDLRPLFDSGEYDFIFIENLIKTYRTTYTAIPKLWSVLEKCFKWVIKYPHEFVYYPHKKGWKTDRHLLTFWNDKKGTICLQLPSGRILYYRRARLVQEQRGSNIAWHWGHLWGGSIVENVVQAIARDLLGYWILEFEKEGLPVVLHSHDEIVSLVPKRQAREYLAFAITIMSHGPDWAEGLPLDAEGEISERYKK
jgi:DNA polymerase bacteriophage-type